MKFLLAAVNAKYIHSNLGVYSLKAYAEKQQTARGEATSDPLVEIRIGEYTINQRTDDILGDIYRRRPDAVGFSCYIWNIRYVRELIGDLAQVMPELDIWLGGPEVSYDAEAALAGEPEVDGILMGEGEETFDRLIRGYENGLNGEELKRALADCRGLALRFQDGTVKVNPMREALDLNMVPFPYDGLQDFEHRIIYYESSRGCPFSCSYCLSSLDKKVRMRDLVLVRQELDFFLRRRVAQVKFVDRTFNCRRDHALAVWRYIAEHDNGVTNFHFEISADLLDEEELELLGSLRPGAVQLEIGVQSTCPGTLKAICRRSDERRLKAAVAHIHARRNVHQHLDLIAGLPFEGCERFARSFDEVFAMEPDQLQLGFLKVLKGSQMEREAGEYGLLYRKEPPYEVLATRWLGFDELLRLKGVEEMVEVYYNSGQFSCTLEGLLARVPSPFALFEALAEYYEEKGFFGISINRIRRYEILDGFVQERLAGLTAVTNAAVRSAAAWPVGNAAVRSAAAWPVGSAAVRSAAECSVGKAAELSTAAPSADGSSLQEEFRQRFTYDLYLRENLKSRPGFCRDQAPYRAKLREFYERESIDHVYLPDYREYDARQLSSMTHMEVFSDGRAALFDYRRRDPLSYNAHVQIFTGFQDPFEIS